MSEEEKNAIEYLKRFIEDDKINVENLCELEDEYEDIDLLEQRICRFEEILKLIEILQKQ